MSCSGNTYLSVARNGQQKSPYRATVLWTQVNRTKQGNTYRVMAWDRNSMSQKKGFTVTPRRRSISVWVSMYSSQLVNCRTTTHSKTWPSAWNGRMSHFNGPTLFRNSSSLMTIYHVARLFRQGFYRLLINSRTFRLYNGCSQEHSNRYLIQPMSVNGHLGHWLIICQSYALKS